MKTSAQHDWSQWAWFAGPHEDELTWGRYPTRRAAICEGNGYCNEDGEVFYICEARGIGSEPDDEGMIQFAEHRKAQRVLSTDGSLWGDIVAAAMTFYWRFK